MALIPLSAYGIYVVVNFLIKKSSKFIGYVKENQKQIIGYTMTTIIVLASFIALFRVDDGDYLPEGRRPKSGQLIVYSMDDKDYQAIKFLETQSTRQVVIADTVVSAAIYPISRNYIVASAQNQYDGFGGGKREDIS